MSTTIIEIDHGELSRLAADPGPLVALLNALQAGQLDLTDASRGQGANWCVGVDVLAQRADGEPLVIEWK